MATVRVLYDLIARDSASREFDRAGRSASSLETSLARVGRAMTIAGGAVAAGAVAIGAESVRMATSFQASMEKVRTQAGASQKSVESLSQAVLKLGTHTQQGPQELADSLFHLKSVGLDNAKAMMALRTASNLAAVGGASLEDTTNALAGAWRSGIKGAQNFGSAAATLNAIVGAGNMRMTDLVDAMGTGFLPSARSFGLSLKSVGAALALMTDEGIPANVAATRLRMSFSLLAAPSKAAEAQLNSIGLTGLKLATTMRSPGGLVAAIGLLKQHLDASGLSLSQQAILLSHAFGGGRSSSAILTLLNNYDVLERKQQQINTTLSKYGPAVEAQRKTAAAQFALLRSNIDVIGVRIGLALLPPVTKFAHFLATTVVPGAVKAAGAIGRVFESVIPVKTIERDWNDVLKFLGISKPKVPKPKPVSLAWSDMWHIEDSGVRPSPLLPGKWKPSPVKVSSSDLLHITSGHPSPAQNSAFTTFMGGMTPQKTAAGIGAVFSKVNWGTALGSLPAKFAGGVLDAFGKINWASMGAQFAPAALSFIINFAASLLDPMTWLKVIKSSWPALLSLILTAITIPFGGEGGTLFKALADVVEHIPILKVFTPLLRGIDTLLKPLAKVWRGLLSNVFGKAASFIDDLLSKVPSKLLTRGTDIMLSLGSGAERIWGKSVYPFFGRIGRLILGAFKGAAVWLLVTGGNIVLGLLHGITAKMAGIGDWIKGNIVDPVINWVKHFFGIHSPSTVFHGIGFNLVAGLLRGMMSHDITAFVKSLFGSMPKALGSIVSKGLVAIADLPAKALGLLGDLGGLLGKLFGGGGSAGAGVQRWAPTVLKVLSMLGQPAAALPVVLSQMMTESGGNPNAINLWDSNAKAGDPSRGLMQVIGTTFSAYAGPFRGLGIYNPLANIYAGLNYAIHRYGPQGWMSVLGHGHGYAGGTGSAAKGWAWVGERGPELVRFGGGEQVLDSATSKAVGGYASGTKDPARSIMLSLEKASTSATIFKDMRRFLALIADHFSGEKEKHLQELVRSQADKMARAADDLKAVRKDIAAAKSFQVATRQSLSSYAAISGLNLTGSYGYSGGQLTYTSGAASVADQLKGKLGAIRKFGSVIKRLAKAHAPASLIRQVVNLGVDQGTQFGLELLSDPASMRAIAGLEKQISSAETSVSRGAASAGYGLGYHTGSGFIDGLRKQQGKLDQLMRHLGKTLGQEASKWFGLPTTGRHHKKLAHGGWLMQPVMGFDAAGNTYSLAENGPEYVGPRGRGSGRNGPLIHIEHYHPTERADLDLLARAVVFGIGA